MDIEISVHRGALRRRIGMRWFFEISLLLYMMSCVADRRRNI